MPKEFGTGITRPVLKKRKREVCRGANGRGCGGLSLCPDRALPAAAGVTFPCH